MAGHLRGAVRTSDELTVLPDARLADRQDNPRTAETRTEDEGPWPSIKLPAKAGLHPLENQSTAMLAWLIDRSRVFACEFVELSLARDRLPTERSALEPGYRSRALTAASCSRTWATLGG